MKKNSFVVRFESVEQVELLTDEQCGVLFKAMCRYAFSGEMLVTSDPLLKYAFADFKGKIDRDSEKYEETCRKNAENGRKGGRPKKSERFSQKPKKTERFFKKPKKADSDSDVMCCDSERDPDCDPVCVPDPECAGAHDTAHTHASISVENVLKLAEQFGYQWSRQEAADFLAYNLDKGRTDGWSYAVQRWEKNRPKHGPGSSRRKRAEDTMTPEELAQMNEYLSVVNRFREDEEGANG
jgi:hypothetical protein